MCWKFRCPFRHRRLPDTEGQLDEVTNILIFGITGMIGSAVLDAIAGCAWFKVSGLTRQKQGKAFDELVARGVRVILGDMSRPRSLANAMIGIDTVFLVTSFWDSKSAEEEYHQGVNVVNAAIENTVKHLIYVGTDYSVKNDVVKCRYLEGKSMVENYIVAVGIPFTLLHMGFYYENFLSIFKPHRTGPTDFALALPLGDMPLNCGSLYDFGHCIGKIALQPSHYLFRTLQLATAYKTVTNFAAELGFFFRKIHFSNPQITLDNFRSLEIPEAKDLASIFEHYQTVSEWDRTDTYTLYPSWRTFEGWLTDNSKDFLNIIHRKNTQELRLEPAPQTVTRHAPSFLSRLFGMPVLKEESNISPSSPFSLTTIAAIAQSIAHWIVNRDDQGSSAE